MDVSSHVALTGEGRLPGVDPHADPDLCCFGPGMVGQCELGLCGRDRSICGTREGVKEGVSLGVDLDAATR